MDGVLAPTEHKRAQAHALAVSELGGSVPPSFYGEIGGVGRAHEEVRRAFIKKSGIHVSEEKYTKIFRRILERTFQDARPTPCIPLVLTALERKGYLQGIVSSSARPEVETVLRAIGCADFFEFWVGGDEVQNKKPAPDAYRLALDRLHINPAMVVAVEDSEVGVQSAVAAGLSVIAYRHKYNRAHDFSGASEIVDSFRNSEEFLKLVEKLTTV